MVKDREPRVDSELKKTINQEGWEGNKEGGAAVFVGTKEEIERAKEIMENEGRAENLETYIRLHKEIILPNSEIEDGRLEEGIKTKKGARQLYLVRDGDGDEFILRYIDRNGDIAKVKILTDKIDEMKHMDKIDEKKVVITESQLWKKINEKLDEMGFFFESIDVDNTWGKLNTQETRYKRRLEKKAEDRKKEEFDF